MLYFVVTLYFTQSSSNEITQRKLPYYAVRYCLLFLVMDKGSCVFDSFKITYKRLFKKHKDKDAI